ncbi:unnamed protein product [Heterobilharzia americana]|nr:unnamed protein product [Heterobilharzia americana]
MIDLTGRQLSNLFLLKKYIKALAIGVGIAGGARAGISTGIVVGGGGYRGIRSYMPRRRRLGIDIRQSAHGGGSYNDLAISGSTRKRTVKKEIIEEPEEEKYETVIKKKKSH